MLKKLLAALTMSYAALSFAAVDVNTATPAELDSIKGIGPAMSAKIIKERKKGNFKDWADLKARVKGVGEKNAASFSRTVCFLRLWLLALENRDTGGKIRVMAVPAVGTAPSRKARSTNA